MTQVLRCDGCGAITPSTEEGRLGWLLVKRYEGKDEDSPMASYGLLDSTSQKTVLVGHCCSLDCMAVLALAQNDSLPDEAGST